jgi:hypothetical protein
MRLNSTIREEKARQLVQQGKVTLYVGKGYAEVIGCNKTIYRLTRGSCDCSDFRIRGATCKHRLAAMQLCAEYRVLMAVSEQGRRIRPPAALLQAIRWPERAIS